MTFQVYQNHPSGALNYTSKAAGGKIMNNPGIKQLKDCGDKHCHNLCENNERQEKSQHNTSNK